MNEMTASFPPDLEEWIDSRIAEGRYLDAGDYLRDLVRRDQEGGFSESPEEIAQIRQAVREGFDSGVSDKDPFELLKELRAGKYDGEA